MQSTSQNLRATRKAIEAFVTKNLHWKISFRILLICCCCQKNDSGYSANEKRSCLRLRRANVRNMLLEVMSGLEKKHWDIYLGWQFVEVFHAIMILGRFNKKIQKKICCMMWSRNHRSSIILWNYSNSAGLPTGYRLWVCISIIYLRPAYHHWFIFWSGCGFSRSAFGSTCLLGIIYTSMWFQESFYSCASNHIFVALWLLTTLENL